MTSTEITSLLANPLISAGQKETLEKLLESAKKLEAAEKARATNPLKEELLKPVPETPVDKKAQQAAREIEHEKQTARNAGEVANAVNILASPVDKLENKLNRWPLIPPEETEDELKLEMPAVGSTFVKNRLWYTVMGHKGRDLVCQMQSNTLMPVIVDVVEKEWRAIQ
jgi:hypothetical protein